MRLSLKFIGILWLLLFIVLGGLLYNAYSKLRPEAFTQLIRQQVQRNYPGAELNLEKITYSFSLDFKFGLEKIHLRRNGKLLAQIGLLELRIPWWLFIVNQGNAQVYVQDLDIYVDQEAESETSNNSIGKKNTSVTVSLPSYLSEARYTLRANNISIRDIKSARRYFVLSKLLVREFQYGKNSAFELNIPVSIKRNNLNYSSELWLFGDLTPRPQEWALNYRGEFRTKDNSEKFQFEDLVIDGKAVLNPTRLNVSSELQFSIDKTPVANGSFIVDQDLMDFNLKISHLPLNYASFIFEDIKTPYLRNPEGFTKGSFNFKKRHNSHVANFSGKIIFDGNFYFSEKDTLAGLWQIGLQDNRLEISFMSPRGEASFFRRSVIDPESASVTQYIEELGFSGLDLRLAAVALPSIQDILNVPSKPFYTSTVSIKGCLLGDKVYDGQFKYGHTPEQSFYQGEFRDEHSFLVLKFLKAPASYSFELEAKQFSWNSSFRFIEPYFSAEAGKLDGLVQGQWNGRWDEGRWVFKIKNRELSESNGFYIQMLDKTASLFDLDIKNYKDHQFNLTVKNNILDLSALLLEDSVSAKISGKLSSKQKSFLNLSLLRKNKTQVLKKEVAEPFWVMKE